MADSDCQLWPRARVAPNGYGIRKVDGRWVMVHREVYEEFHGPIPDGHHVHHVCGTPACVNPEHLRAVSAWEHIREHDSPAGINATKTHCIHGHQFTPENTYMAGTRRQCRTCLRAARRRFDARKRAAA